MEIVMRKTDELIPYVNNARKNDHAVDAVASSIKNYGFKQPIVIDAQGEVVAGHTRLKAAKKLGLKEVPVIVADDLTPAQVKAYRIADNRVGELAEWDMELLQLEMADIEGFTGFEDLELTDKVEKGNDDDFDADDEMEKIDESITQRGWIYKLGNHRLMCGDSTNEEDVKRLMDGKIADMTFTSPPYNAGKTEKLSGNTHTNENKYNSYNDENENYGQLLFDSTKNSIKNSLYSFINLQMLAGNKKELVNFLHYFNDNLVDIMIWNKVNSQPAMASNVLNSQFEFIFIFSNEKNPKRSIKISDFRGTVPNVLTMNSQRKNEFSNIHAATFSIDFAKYFIDTFSQKKMNILDIFGGTGTTMIACEELNRKCFMMELDRKYCDVIVKRWENMTGQKAERI